MPFLDHIPGEDVFLRLSAGDDLTTETEDCRFYVMTERLHRRCEAEAANLPAAELALLRLLSAATSLQLHVGSKQPLQGLFRSDTQRSAAIEDFGENDAHTLLRFAELVRDPALKARLTDVVT